MVFVKFLAELQFFLLQKMPFYAKSMNSVNHRQLFQTSRSALGNVVYYRLVGVERSR